MIPASPQECLSPAKHFVLIMTVDTNSFHPLQNQIFKTTPIIRVIARVHGLIVVWSNHWRRIRPDKTPKDRKG